jgi:group II intron reverse transcriptase/maturase
MPRLSSELSTKFQQIAEHAKRRPEMSFSSLNHLLTLELLEQAFAKTPRDKAPGVDGQTWKDYAANLAENLPSLLDRAHSGRYFAPPVRRTYVPKDQPGEKRPLGIPTIEDKVLQRAVVMILETVYEPLFHEGSYGFRPGRSAHQALQSLYDQLSAWGGGWIIDADIRRYFDTLDHGHLRELLSRRVRDGVLIRLIGKWLNAGVLEDGKITHPDEGTPQGGVVSPLLANVYLHYVLDEWFEQDVKPRLRSSAFLIRYADDFVLAFRNEQDAREVLALLGARFAAYGLTIHPEKTRLVKFRPVPRAQKTGAEREQRPPSTFDFPGLTHHWGRSRKGQPVVKQKTSSKRFTRTITRISQWCRSHRHDKICDQHATLSSKLQGHYQYYGITGNFPALKSLLRAVERVWRTWLTRRNRRRSWSWKQHQRMLKRWALPPPRIVHTVYLALLNGLSRLLTRSDLTGGTGCVNCARPVLWEPWAATPRATRMSLYPFLRLNRREGVQRPMR